MQIDAGHLALQRDRVRAGGDRAAIFLLIRKRDRVCVGSADFKGGPDEAGAVEIGYGLGEEFEGHGYMTEAVGALCAWALRQRGEMLWWALVAGPCSIGGERP